MEFVKVNYSLNRTYFVETTAIEGVVKNTFFESKDAKLLSSDVRVTPEQKVYITVVIEPKKGITLTDLLVKLTKMIERNYKNVIGRNPDNIQVSFGKAK